MDATDPSRARKDSGRPATPYPWWDPSVPASPSLSEADSDTASTVLRESSPTPAEYSPWSPASEPHFSSAEAPVLYRIISDLQQSLARSTTTQVGKFLVSVILHFRYNFDT